MTYENILTETRGRVAVITLNRPQRLNALNDAIADEIKAALEGYDADPDISVVVVTGSAKAFAAGADIGAMADWSYAKVLGDNYITRNWEAVRHARKPVIAAVAGYALGGGCELAMACDFIIAADTAKFGQPEITIGTMPGFGGTQRLPRAVGKAKAMDWCLTGRMIDAAEAEKAGLVSRLSRTVRARAFFPSESTRQMFVQRLTAGRSVVVTVKARLRPSRAIAGSATPFTL